MRNRRTLATLVLTLACSSGLCLAQTTGGIEGTVRDTSGSPLPGVTVEATSPKMPGVRLEASGRDGRYRFVAIPPGKYRVKVNLEGFEPVEETVRVALDATVTLDFKLTLAVKEAVTVGANAPRVDVTSTTTGTNYTSEVIARLPVDRNYADIVRANPGVDSDRGTTNLGVFNPDRRAQGRTLALTIYGATSLENEWIIDGINTTNVAQGFQGKALGIESIDEVEVKTGGYQAEYGGALGGIVNVITKSGGNQFRGGGFVYYDSENTRAHQVVTDQDIVSGVRIGSHHRADFGADLGGYILRDRLWFFGAYDRTETPGFQSNYTSTPLVPNTMLFPRDQTENLFSGKLTWNISSRANLVATAVSDASKIEGAAWNLFIVNPDPSTWETIRRIGGLDVGLRASQLLGSSALLTAQVSRHRDRFELFPFAAGNGVRQIDETCAGGTPDNPCSAPSVPNSITGGIGFYGGPNQKSASQRDQYDLNAVFYPGSHEVKLGGDYQGSRTTATSSFSGGQRVWKFNEFGQTYYEHDFFAASPTDLTPVDRVLEPRSYELALFGQDSWKPIPNLTFNAGLRWEQLTAKDYAGTKIFNLTAEWQPRLGIVWDPSGRGVAKIYASAGRFYFSFPTDVSMFGFSGSTFVQTYNFDPVDKTQNPAVIGHERAHVSISGVQEPVDSRLKGIYQDELILGVERILDPTFSVGLKGTYRSLGRVIEDRCDLDYNAPENNGFSCAYVNPGSGGKYASGDFASCNGLDGNYYACQQGAPPSPAARRLYRGIELLARKSVGEKLWLQASYIYSSLRGNYDGFVNENSGQSIPGFGPDFDYPQLAHNNYGRLFLDRPHSFRLDAAYTTPFHLFIGVQGYAQSGAPLDRLGYFSRGYGAAINLMTRGEAGRLPTLWEANLTIGYPLALGPATITLQAYVLNLFNNQIETQQDVGWTTQAPAGYPANLYDPNVPSNNPNYGKILARQSPRLVRGAVKVSF